MRVLFDQNLPHKLRSSLLDAGEHEILTAAYLGWSALKNGELLRAAEAEGFEVFVTGDASLVREQNLSGRALAIVVLSTNNWPILQNNIAQIIEAIDSSAPGSLRLVECGRFAPRRRL